MGRDQIVSRLPLKSPLSWRNLLRFVVSLSFVLLTTPLVPYRPVCGDAEAPGPYRKVYVDQVDDWFEREGVFYWRIGNTILLPILHITSQQSWERFDPINDAEKISDDFENSITIDGVFYPSPPEVKRLRRLSPGSYDLQDLCKAAVRVSPTDPPDPPGWWQRWF